MHNTLPAHVHAFAALFPGSLNHFSSVGPLVGEGWSPGDLHHCPVNEETGWTSPEALRAAGWPLAADFALPDPEQVFFELPVLPWIGHIAAAEADDTLTIDGMERAVAFLIEPEAGGPFYGMSWRAGVRLMPGKWLVLSLALHDNDGQPRALASALLVVWAVAGQTERVVMVLPHGEVYRQGYRRILGVGQADLDGALDDMLSGSLL